MRNTTKLFGIIAIVAVIGLSFASCGDNGGGGGGGGGYTPTAGLYRTTGQTIVAADRVDLDLEDTNLVAAAVAHVNDNPGTFTLLVGADVTVDTATTSLAENVHLTVEGIGGRRTITRSGNGSLFTVNGANRSLTLGDNITLEGHSGNNNLLVNVLAGGSLTMNAGAWITGNTVSGSGTGGAVNVSGAGSTFTMNGGEIFGNTANDSAGGGVRVAVEALFVMHEGAVIRDNTATGNNSGGGMRVLSGASFVMHEGAVIRDNEAEGNNSAGGVFVGDTGNTFTMLGGEIRGNEATGATSTVGGVRVNIGAFRMVNGVIYGGDEGDTNSNTGVTNHALLLAGGGTATLGTMVDGVFTPEDPAVTLGNTDDTIRVEDGVRQPN